MLVESVLQCKFPMEIRSSLICIRGPLYISFYIRSKNAEIRIPKLSQSVENYINAQHSPVANPQMELAKRRNSPITFDLQTQNIHFRGHIRNWTKMLFE